VDAKAEKSSDGSWESTACKPVWDAGAAVPLSLKKKSAAPVPAPAKKVLFSSCAFVRVNQIFDL
jgi:hypothetical protein